ncbi:transcriptional regulator, GntR family [Georgenia satyanarayanai]|uniref:Transcriptional regulator, GntR family n=1 Tax=Georgenia satyanarayanai TaxID=860221 RepID=A0A2Y9AS55_9MICO|nr:GntR family transcriptional regulator [Georgenia satyanarayanai]SSA47281.1 transcriptional regulator, GntR family [Georgenia satyanarayanai]
MHTLSERISAGELRTGQRLGSESAIAAEFGVSRGTVRQALQDLQRLELIATRAGVGSFVTFDGQPLDADAGWARALTAAGAEVTTEILAITLEQPAARPPELAGRDVVVVSRRRLLAGRPVSYERATIPATGQLRDLPTTGLVDDSLTATLRAAGLAPGHGTQDVRVTATSPEVAAVLEHEPGTPFLHTTRTSYTRSGELVEHVESYLDPAHFSLHLTFGEPA